MTPEEMRILYDYNAWANHRQLQAASKLTTEQFLKPMGSSFGSVRDTLAHIYGAEWVWLKGFHKPSASYLVDRKTARPIQSYYQGILLPGQENLETDSILLYSSADVLGHRRVQE